MPPKAKDDSQFIELLPHHGADPLPDGKQLKILQEFLHEAGFLALVGKGSAKGAAPPSKLPKATLGKSKKETALALKHYQKFQAMAVTGRLDDDTTHLMAFPRCGQANFQRSGSALHEAMRSAALAVAGGTGNITYTIRNGSQHLSRSAVFACFEAAFEIWANVINRSFVEVASGGTIQIRFIGRRDGTAEYESAGGLGTFEGKGRNLAWAEVGGTRTHFDDEEIWRLDQPPLQGTASGIDLISVAAHEIGHILGLDHSGNQDALMFDTHFGHHRFITDDDERRVRAVFGLPPLPAGTTGS